MPPTDKSPARRTGRPRSSLSPETQDRIIELVRSGSFLKRACVACGVDPSGVFRWQRRVEANDPEAFEYVSFFHLLKSAEVQAELAAIKKVRSGRPGWQSSARWLERRFPSLYGRTQVRRLDPVPPKPSKPLRAMTDAEIDCYETTLKKSGG